MKMKKTTLIIIALASITAILSIAYHQYNRTKCTVWVEVGVGDRVYRERLCAAGIPLTRLTPPQQ